MFAALPLVTIRGALGPGGSWNELPDGSLNMGRSKYMQDLGACILAYTTFFEMGERLYDDFQKARGHHINEHDHFLADQSQIADNQFTKDGPIRIIFRQALPVAAGIAPYIAIQRSVQAKAPFGLTKTPWRVEPKCELSYGQSWLRSQGEYQAFFVFTTISEAIKRNYDAVFDWLHEKQNGHLPQHTALSNGNGKAKNLVPNHTIVNPAKALLTAPEPLNNYLNVNA
jgi:hypothetical protein